MMAFAQSPKEALQTLLNSSSLDKNQTAIYIWDLEGDYKVVGYLDDRPITPASVMKCVSVAELSSKMKYNTKLVTNVYTEGNTSNGVLNGNIVVVGCGDPSLGDGRHQGQPDFVMEIVNALKSKGITSITGDIVIDDSRFAGPSTHPSWGKGDLNTYYGTGVHAFNFEGNASGKTAIHNPAGVFKRKLTDALKANGIAFNQQTVKTNKQDRKLLMAHKSPDLSKLMQSCLFRSDNMYAESFLRLFGLKVGTDGSVAQSAKAATRHWETLGLDVTAVNLVDGSGLSRNNKLTAQFLGEILKAKSNDPMFVSLLPLVGEEGTVRNFLKGTPLQAYMALKTGSMNGIQSYAGYVVDEDFAPTHVVVVMTNGLKNRDNYRAALSKFFLTLFKR